MDFDAFPWIDNFSGNECPLLCQMEVRFLTNKTLKNNILKKSSFSKLFRILKLISKKLNASSNVSQSTTTDSKHYQIRHLSGTSSELTFGPSNLSTVSTNISGPRANHEMRTISTYGTDIVFSESTNGTYVLYHHPDLHHDVRSDEIFRSDGSNNVRSSMFDRSKPK